jgi:hypothetical protein
MSSDRVVAVLACLLVAGCAYPDVRSAAYSHLGSDVVVMRPPNRLPPARTVASSNNFQFVPGAIVRPQSAAILPRDDFARKAEEWGITSARRCYPSARLYRLQDTGPLPRTPDIIVEYVLDASLWNLFDRIFRGEPPAGDTLRAQRELNLARNDLRFVRRIQIHLRNITHYQGDTEQLLRSRTSILAQPGCRRLLAGGRQIVRIYSAELFDVRFEIADGASIDVALLKARILRTYTKSVHGANVFFALHANSIEAAKP